MRLAIDMDKLTELLEELLDVPVETVEETAQFRETLGWDSLTHMRLVVGIQAAFGINLDRDEIRRLTSLSEIRAVLSERKAA